jgi:hypothetical protein
VVFEDDRRDGSPRPGRHRRPVRIERRMVGGVVVLAVVAGILSVAITVIGHQNTKPLRPRLPPPVFTLPASPSGPNVLLTPSGNKPSKEN